MTRIDYAKAKRPRPEPLPDDVEWCWINKRSGVVHVTRGCEALIEWKVSDYQLRTVRREDIGRARRCRRCWH